MAIAITEFDILKKGTEMFIAADLIPVEFTRRVREQLPSGGYRYTDPVVLAPQNARLIPSQDKEKELETDEGKVAFPDYVLLMMPDADVKRHDRFILGAFEFLVLSEPHGPEYLTKVDVMRCGR